MSAGVQRAKDRMCGACVHWELVPQGCCSFWGRCLYDGTETPSAVSGRDAHFEEGEDCPCWEKRRP